MVENLQSPAISPSTPFTRAARLRRHEFSRARPRALDPLILRRGERGGDENDDEDEEEKEEEEEDAQGAERALERVVEDGERGGT